MADLISIIIPVYNSYLYLDRCISSLQNQSYKNLEIILVNDGSTDRSGELLDKYANEDQRIKVVHQKNGGISNATNRGLKEASGDYIGFMDNDDWVHPEMYRILHESIIKHDTDIAECNAFYTSQYIPNHSLKNDISVIIESRTKTLVRVLKTMAFSNWRRLHKRKIIHNVWFDEDIRLSQDAIFSIKSIINANSIAYISEPLYYYFTGNASVTRSSFRKSHLDSVEGAKRIGQVIKKNYPVDRAVKEAYSHFFTKTLIYFYVTITHQSNEDSDRIIRKSLLKEIKKQPLKSLGPKGMLIRFLSASTFEKLIKLKKFCN